MVDPLSLFPSEKLGEAKKERTHQGTAERVVAGLGATRLPGALAGSAYNLATRPSKTPFPSGMHGLGGIKRLEEVITGEVATKPKGKLLGLLDIVEPSKGRTYSVTDAINTIMLEKQHGEGLEDLLRQFATSQGKDPDVAVRGVRGMKPGRDFVRDLAKHHDLVDSFINKHKLPEKGVTMAFKEGPASIFMGDHYSPQRKVVQLQGFEPAAALHELAHAADYTGSRMGKARAILEGPLRAGVAAAVPAALIAGDVIADAIPGSVDDKAIRFIQDNAVPIVGATYAATTLFPEAKANIMAYQHIKKNAPSMAPAAKAQLLKNFGSYMLAAVPLVVGTALAKKYLTEERSIGQSKTAGILQGLMDVPRDLYYTGKTLAGVALRDSWDLFGQVADQTKKLVVEPGTVKKIWKGAKTMATDPNTALDATKAAVPVAAVTYYALARPSAHAVARSDLDPGMKAQILQNPKITEKALHRPAAHSAAIAGIGAGLSAAVIERIIRDLKVVL